MHIGEASTRGPYSSGHGHSLPGIRLVTCMAIVCKVIDYWESGIHFSFSMGICYSRWLGRAVGLDSIGSKRNCHQHHHISLQGFLIFLMGFLLDMLIICLSCELD